jgi:hypothetical protein
MYLDISGSIPRCHSSRSFGAGCTRRAPFDSPTIAAEILPAAGGKLIDTVH